MREDMVESIVRGYPTSMTTSDVAECLNCSRKHVTNLIEAGNLRAVNLSRGGKKCYRIFKADLKDYLSIKIK